MLILKRHLADDIISHCKREFPLEACGILAGKGDKIDIVYAMKNTDRDAVSYFMEPQEQLNTMKDIRKKGLEMLGIYHSHSFSRAYPSKKDVELAFYPEVSYVIISLKDRDNLEISSFKIVEGKIQKEDVRIE
jgi:[CysO sulfur-carrier protein]-S-L-cysteine hydrolase